jgi:hypothetical protein
MHMQALTIEHEVEPEAGDNDGRPARARTQAHFPLVV